MKKNKSANILWIGAAIGLAVFLLMNVAPLLSDDDPSAAEHTVDRDGAAAAAERFVRQQLGGEAPELHSFAMYAADRDVFGYFYKEGTIQDVQRQYQGALPLEAYRVEVKEAETGAVHYVDINPYTGKPAEWNLDVSTGGQPAGRAEAIGREALRELGWTGAEPALLSSDEETGELRFELSDPAFREARATVTVRAGERGAAAVETVWAVPAGYAALVERQNRLSSALGTTGLILSGVLQFAAMIYALAQLKSVRWSRGVVMSLVFGVFYCVLNVNMYPGLKATVLGLLEGGSYVTIGGIDPAAAAAGLIAMLIVTNALTLALAIGMYFSAVAGDTLAARRGWRLWPEPEARGYGASVAEAVRKGYLFAPILLGVQSILFLFAEHSFQTWYTIDALSSPNNMIVPLLMPLLAWCAAVEEEAVYRLFAIPALKKIVRFTIPAVLISSMIWALGHVQYPIYPYYTRFAEVTALGLLFAYIFLKHGFLTAVFAHAVVDLIWMGISIVSTAPTAGHFAAFAFYLATPALVAAIVRLRRPDAAPPGRTA